MQHALELHALLITQSASPARGPKGQTTCGFLSSWDTNFPFGNLGGNWVTEYKKERVTASLFRADATFYNKFHALCGLTMHRVQGRHNSAARPFFRCKSLPPFFYTQLNRHPFPLRSAVRRWRDGAAVPAARVAIKERLESKEEGKPWCPFLFAPAPGRRKVAPLAVSVKGQELCAGKRRCSCLGFAFNCHFRSPFLW